jgi:hypothetical protein
VALAGSGAAAAGGGSRSAVEGGGARKYQWNFVGQTHDKPTRKTMLAAAGALRGPGFVKLTGFWNDSAGLDTAAFRDLLVDSHFTLCPRGFVHPESFRLSEALETGSIPIIEQDAYFAMLFGEDHPLPMLPPPPRCREPETTEYHPPPHPSPHCADVWPALGSLVEAISADLPALHATVAAWWARHKRLVTRRVRALVLHGALWQHHHHQQQADASDYSGAATSGAATVGAVGALQRISGLGRARGEGREPSEEREVDGRRRRVDGQAGREGDSGEEGWGKGEGGGGGGGGVGERGGGGVVTGARVCGHHDLKCRSLFASLDS